MSQLTVWKTVIISVYVDVQCTSCQWNLYWANLDFNDTLYQNMDKRASKTLNGPFSTFFLLVKPVQQAQLLAKLDFVT